MTAKYADQISRANYTMQLNKKKMPHCGKPRVSSKQRHSNFHLPMLRID